MEDFEDAAAWTRGIVVQLVDVLWICELHEAILVELIVRVVGELSEEGAAWNGKNVQVICEKLP